MLGNGLSFFDTSLRRASSPSVVIQSGTGYAGSVYLCSIAGQWYADDVAISGQTSTTLTMTAALEGKAIRCAGSNVIQMWTPAALTTAQKANGGWWGGGIQIEAGGKVTAWPDRFGVRDMTQATTANQPGAGLIGARPVAIWPSAGNDCSINPAVAFAPAWWLLVMQYRDGLAATWANSGGVNPGYFGLITNGAALPSSVRVMAAQSGTSALYQPGTGWTGQAARNAGAYSTTLLPLPLSLVELCGASLSGIWGIGRGAGGDDLVRGWQGPMMMAIACGEEPTGDALARLQGYAAHACGLESSLPEGHACKTNAPRIS